MLYLVLDTNIWLYLANGYDSQKQSREQNIHRNGHISLFDTLDLFVGTRQLEILVNEQIIREWERNEKAQLELIEDLSTKKLELRKSINTIKSFLPENRWTDLESILSAVHIELDRRIERNKTHIKNVETFLRQKCIHIPTSSETNNKVLEAALAKVKAPFITNKNNLADALILYSVVEYLEEGNVPLSGVTIFVSNNHKEFADSSGERFHPDIEEIVGSLNLRYERTLPQALDIGAAIREEFEDYLDSLTNEWDGEEPEDGFICECSYYETHYGNFSIEMKFVSGPDDFFNPNQLSLFDFSLNIEPLIIRAGECDYCGALTVECPHCESLMCNHEDDQWLSCEPCGKHYKCTIRVDGFVMWEDELYFD